MGKSIFALLAACMLLCSVPAYGADTLEVITSPDQAHALFAKAMNEKNLEQLCAMYADDAVMVLRSGNLKVQGKSTIRKVFTEMIAALESLELDIIYQVRSEDTVLFRSKYRSVYHTSDGVKHDVVSSGIEVLRKQPDGTWLFTIDHHNGGDNILPE